MTADDFIEDLEDNIYCRLQPSSVHGVGVFAIRDIPKGINMFGGCKKVRWSKVPLKKVFSKNTISDGVKELVKDLYVIDDDMVYFPDHGLNDVNISYFVNNSDNPNVNAIAGGEEFIANRDIKKGEELFVDYRTYTS